MTGELPYSEVLKLMQQAKIFLHPSSYEGFGCVCLEALQAGAHVISFCKPMNMDITHWHIVKDKDVAIEKALGLLSDQHTGYNPVKGFSIKGTVTTMMKLLEEN
jgi:glycosyltransferase involved in cell wall biosynthesis